LNSHFSLNHDTYSSSQKLQKQPDENSFSLETFDKEDWKQKKGA